MPTITSQHLTGFLVGLGAAAGAYYLYRKNQPRVDEFLRSHGIPIPEGGQQPLEQLTLEELVAQKERLEDLIAERTIAAPQPTEA